ncbi:hypothetical protein [Flavobacterium caeni]|uniref:Uncharacterized protein n=1 Tax=Flavobacterium caeni TaxID=490189 RepID=A0A1G5K3L4_9FLAO|nr:hypothetical protein [Flavobacterium caeni]SCY94660.1 hypothetical protein SAMN02927903_03043 [Flavobacterium caeni]
MSKHKEKAEKFLQDHPQLKEVYVTAEGFMFVDKKYALQHNGTLAEGSEIETFVNPNAPAIAEDPASPSGAAATQNAPKASTPKASTPKATTPKATTPKASTPKASTPKATTPKATTPKASETPKIEETPKPEQTGTDNANSGADADAE